MAAVTICSYFGAPKNKVSHGPQGALRAVWHILDRAFKSLETPVAMSCSFPL